MGSDWRRRRQRRVSLFTAPEEQLGLKLEGERTTMDVVAIERVERPTAN